VRIGPQLTSAAGHGLSGPPGQMGRCWPARACSANLRRGPPRPRPRTRPVSGLTSAFG